ncbi:MAG: helix-turn-helix domain-containing protein [Terracidiphilus sp.]
MFYLEHKPAPPLDAAVWSLWYARDCDAPGGRQLVLPTGRAQFVISLAREFLLDFSGDGPAHAGAAAQVVGARSVYELIDASDLKDLIGVAFHPGGFPLVTREASDQFTNRNVDMEALWGADARRLREQLREASSPWARLHCLESFLRQRMAAGPVRGAAERGAMVAYALRRFHAGAAVSGVARGTGWCERRFSQVFREETGLTPAVWRRVQRFQRAIAQLHSGAAVRWEELALDCGFYDQAHFANEFHAFSGMDASAYVAAARPWANHVRAE